MTILDAIKQVFKKPIISLGSICSIVPFFCKDLQIRYKIMILCLYLIMLIVSIIIVYISGLKRKISELSNQQAEENNQVVNCKINKDYLGTWIQYIPEFPRKIAVCNLKYSNGSYHFSGINFGEYGERNVEFNTYKLIQGGPDQFFYITSAHNPEKPEEGEIHGFGKINFRKRSSGIYKADGYFFDVDSALGKTGHRAIQHFKMLKHDKMLYKQFKRLNCPRGDNTILQMRDIQIYEAVRDHTDIFKD